MRGARPRFVERGARLRPVLGLLLLGMVGGSARGSGITELVIGGAGGPSAVEWQAPLPAGALSEGVTLVAFRVTGSSSRLGLVEGAWHAPLSGATVALWHEGPADELPGFLIDTPGLATEAMTLPTSGVSWESVGLAVFAGDVTAEALALGASLASPVTQVQLGAGGLLSGLTATPTGESGWWPDAAGLGRMGVGVESWSSVEVAGPGVYREAAGEGWLGGEANAIGDVWGDGYVFLATPGQPNQRVTWTHAPEPGTLALLGAGLLACGRQRARGVARSCRDGRCGRLPRGL